MNCRTHLRLFAACSLDDATCTLSNNVVKVAKSSRRALTKFSQPLWKHITASYAHFVSRHDDGAEA